MKIGIPTLIEFNSINENISLAVDNDCDFIELNLNFEYIRRDLEKKAIKKTDNLFFTLHFFDEADFASYEVVCKAYIILFKKYVKLASKINTKSINIHLNTGPVVTINGEKNYLYALEYRQFITRLINNLKKLRKIANYYKIELVIENIKVPPFLQEAYQRLLLEGFYFNYDVGHDYTDSGWIHSFYNDNIHNFKEIHFHDATKKKCHLCLETGELNIQDYYNIIKEKLVVLEVKSKLELEKSISIIKKFGDNYEL